MGDNINESRTNAGSQRGSRRRLIILGIVGGIVFTAMAAVIVVMAMKMNTITPATTTSPDSSAQAQEKREVIVTEDNVKEVIEQMEQVEYVPPGYYTVTQNYDWHFPTGDTASTDAHVENVVENTHDVYFDLFLESDSEKPIYQSPVIPLGAALEDFKLDTKLEAGTYDCIMVYHLVDKDQNTVSTVSMTVTVIVEG